MMKMDSIDLSMPQKRTVRGYELTRATLGVFLQAIRRAEGFPAEMLNLLFPGMSLPEILLLLKDCNSEAMGQILSRALVVVPEQAISMIADITGIPEERLTNDPAIGLDGLAELLSVWYEVNRIENFTQTAADLLQKIRSRQKGRPDTGSKA